MLVRTVRIAPALMATIAVLVAMVEATLRPMTAFQPPGTVATVATTPNVVYHAIVDPVDATIYFTQAHCVNRIPYGSTTVEVLAGSSYLTGYVDGVGSAARFYVPWGVAQGIRNRTILYIAEYANRCLRTVHIPTGTVTTMAGQCGPAGDGNADGIGASARFKSPSGIAIALVRNVSSATDAVEILYVSDFGNGRIRRVDVATGAVTTVALSGDTAAFDPTDIAIVLDATTVNATDGGSGVLKWMLIGDYYNTVRLVDATSDSSGVMATLAGNGSSGYQDGVGSSAMFRRCYGVTVADVGPTPMGSNGARRNTIVAYVADYNNCAVRQVTMDGVVTTVVGGLACGSRVNGDVSIARFNVIYGLRVYTLGHRSNVGVERGLLIPDTLNYAVRSLVLNCSSTTVTVDRSLTASPSRPGTTGSTTATIPRSSHSHSPSQGASSTSSHSFSASWLLPTESSSGSSTASRSNTSAMASISIGEPTPTATHSVCSTTASDRSTSVSPSSWYCGALDVRNASLGVPDDRIVAVTAEGTGAARVLVLQPTEHPALHRPLTEAASVLEAMAVPRVALVWTANEPVPLLAVRLPAAWANMRRWRVMSAWSQLHGNATLDFIEDRAMTGSWTVTLHAPQSSRLGWLSGSVVMTESTWIMVALALACAAEGGNITGRTTTVVVAIPAPGAESAITRAVATATTVTQWTTAVGGPGSGTAVGRVGAVRSMVLCGNDDDGDNKGPSGGGLLGVAIGVEDPSCAGSTGSASARGAVVGNGGILACFASLVGLSTVAYAMARPGGAMTAANLRAASLRLGVPSVLLPVGIATLPSTAAGGMTLLLGGSSTTRSPCAGDIVIGLLGLLMCVVPVVWICYVSFRLVPRLGLHPVDRGYGPLHNAKSVFVAVLDALRVAFARRIVWVAQTKRRVDNSAQGLGALRSGTEDQMAAVLGLDASVTPAHVVEEKHTMPNQPTSAESSTPDASRQAQVLLHEFRVVPYAVVDVGVLVVSGVLSAVSGVGSQGLCVGAGSTIAVLYGLQFAVCAVTRPFTSTFALVHALMTLALSCTSVGLQVGAMSAAPSSDATSLETMKDLMTATAACDLCVIGITAVRLLLDIFGLLKAVLRVLREFRTDGPQGAVAGNVKPIPPLPEVCPMIASVHASGCGQNVGALGTPSTADLHHHHHLAVADNNGSFGHSMRNHVDGDGVAHLGVAQLPSHSAARLVAVPEADDEEDLLGRILDMQDQRRFVDELDIAYRDLGPIMTDKDL